MKFWERIHKRVKNGPRLSDFYNEVNHFSKIRPGFEMAVFRMLFLEEKHCFVCLECLE